MSDNWFVSDAAVRDPWGLAGNEWGPMTEEEAKAMVENGAAQIEPRHYWAHEGMI